MTAALAVGLGTTPDAVAGTTPAAPLGLAPVPVIAGPAATTDPVPPPPSPTPTPTPTLSMPNISPFPPSPPTDLAATATTTSVTLTWTASKMGCCAIEGYTVNYWEAFNDVGNTPVVVGNVTTAKITLGIGPGREYRFWVTARDSVGHVSASSPSAPTNLTASNVTATTATLTWSPGTDNTAVTGYNVYRFDGVFVSTLLATVPTTSYTVPLLNGVRNQFYVRARDAVGNVSIASNSVRVNPSTPPTTAPPPEQVCRVTYRNQSEWPGGFLADVTLRNIGPTPYNGWTLTFNLNGGQQVTGSWSATVTQSGTTVTARNLTWNATVPPGASTTFGIYGRWTTSNPPPTLFLLNGSPCGLG
ncbi:cellulose binding domain-containing protein [Micromonospora zhanjiangensis]